ncbi:MAG TPA: pseudouridine synthase [Candidatus Dormibacteraeota bacterium]|nr:pseudouridine synthase [Candidatus Dormibacteraeota bacterium]
MRVNKFVASATGLSRRAADLAIQEGRVAINRRIASLGDKVTDSDKVTLDNQPLTTTDKRLIIILNKPTGYVCSRDGQGSQTVYDILPPEYHHLKPVGRLDKNSSGLLLLTNDGDLANELTHPRYAKAKVYEVTLDKPLAEADKARLDQGVKVDDYVSHLRLSPMEKPSSWQVTMSQGHNRQIRRTFEALGYAVRTLRRTSFGPYKLAGLQSGDHYQEI